MRKKILISALILAISSCASVEAAGVQEGGAQSKRRDIDLPTIESEPKDPKKELGRDFLMAVRKELNFVQEQEVVSLVNRVGKELVEAAGGDPDYYHFFVVKENEINAFAVPGGYIFIYDGLLRNIGGIDALAGVLAHEIAHVERDHLFKDSRKTGMVDLATIVGIILAGSSSEHGASTMATAEAANISYKLKLSREHEEDADMFAIRYLKQSSYNPAGLSGLFKALADYGRLNSANLVPPYLSTHPGVEQRQVIVETLTRDLPLKKTIYADWDRVVTILKAGDGRKGTVNIEEIDNPASKERAHYLRGLYALKSKKTKEALTEYLQALKLAPDNAVYRASFLAITRFC